VRGLNARGATRRNQRGSNRNTAKHELLFHFRVRRSQHFAQELAERE
jgi:hypothetical protein